MTPEGEVLSDETELTLTLERKEWKVARQRSISGRISIINWELETIPVLEDKVSLKGGKFSWDFIPDRAGYYILSASATDEQGRTARDGDGSVRFRIAVV